MRRVPPTQDHRSPAPQPRRSVSVDDDARQFGQPRFDGKKRIRRSAFRLDLVEREGIIFEERTDPGATQRGHMAEATQQSPEIARDGANVSAFSAFHHKMRLVLRDADEVQPMDAHLARLQINFLALASEIVGALAANLDSGILRRRLLNITEETRQQRKYRLGRRARVAFASHLSIRSRPYPSRRPSAR